VTPRGGVALPSRLDFFDYSSAASGMIYFNTQNTAGVHIDGFAYGSSGTR
jgi:hypothetical protein